MSIKKLIIHSGAYGLAPQLPKFFAILALPLITQKLTPFDYGVFGVIAAATAVLDSLNHLGLRPLLFNDYYKYSGHYKYAWRQVYGFLSLWLVVYSVFVALVIYLVIPAEARENLWEIILLSSIPIVVFGNVTNIGVVFYQVQKKVAPVVVRTAAFGSLVVILNIYTIYYLEMGYMGWFWTNAIVHIATSLSYWIPLTFKHKITPIFNFKWRFIKQKLKIALPTIPHEYSSYLLNSSDRLIMKFIGVSTGQIGMYTFAYTFGSYINIVNGAVGKAIKPFLYENYKANDYKKSRNIVLLVTVAIGFLTVFISIWMKEIFGILVSNEALEQGYYIAIIVVMSYAYRPMYQGYASILFYHEKTMHLWKITFVAGLANMILNFIFLPYFGIMAAALSTFSCLVFVAVSGYYMKEFKERAKAKYYPMVWLMIHAGFTILAYLLADAIYPIKGVVSVAILAGIFIIYKKFRSRFALQV